MTLGNRPSSVVTVPGPRVTRRAAVLLAASLALLLPWGGAGPAAQEADVATAEVKVAYLYKFTKFVTWPERAFAGERAAIVIGIAGHDPFGTVIDTVLRGKTAWRRPLEIKRIGLLEQEPLPREALRACHLLFIAEAEQPRVRELLEAVKGAPVLTVSDLRDFAVDGGMIELAPQAGGLSYKVNRKPAKSAGLELSARLLQSAQLVEPGPPEDG